MGIENSGTAAVEGQPVRWHRGVTSIPPGKLHLCI